MSVPTSMVPVVSMVTWTMRGTRRAHVGEGLLGPLRWLPALEDVLRGFDEQTRPRRLRGDPGTARRSCPRGPPNVVWRRERAWCRPHRADHEIGPIGELGAGFCGRFGGDAVQRPRLLHQCRTPPARSCWPPKVMGFRPRAAHPQESLVDLADHIRAGPRQDFRAVFEPWKSERGRSKLCTLVPMAPSRTSTRSFKRLAKKGFHSILRAESNLRW